MIRREQHAQARVLCDGCKNQTMLYPCLQAAVTELPQIGWRDVGAGMTRQGREFRHLCPECWANWKATDQ